MRTWAGTFRIVFVLSLTLAAAQVEARESISMPFACSVENGRIAMRPSATQSYAILGAREEQPFTACTSQQFEQCRTFMVHRFNIDCSGYRVSWMRAVAAARSTTGTRSWLENGRLKLVLASRAKGFIAPPCSDGQGSAAGDCLPWLRSSSRNAVVLPAGFAPIGEIGARIHFGDGPAPAIEPARLEFAKFEHRIPLNADRSSEDTVSIFSTPARADTGAAVYGWVTKTVLPVEEQPADAAPASGRGWYMPALTWVSGAGLLLFTAWFAWQRGHGQLSIGLVRASPAGAASSALGEAAGESAGRFSSAGRSEAPPLTEEERQLANGATFVVGVLKDASERLGRIPQGPLRDVLDQELHAIAQRLGYMRVAAADGRETPAKAAGVFRTLIREVERIRRIAESAEASRGTLRDSAAMPQTLSEAFAVLGVNPDASDQILKKLVDALRMSWHPDLAKDEPDRVLREERIKQINIAWELITSKRQAA